MDIFSLFLLGLLVIGLLGAAYLRLQRNQFMKYARVQEKKLRQFANQTSLDQRARLRLRRNEAVVFQFKSASLAETRRGPRVTHRSGSAFTFRFAPGFYYTALGGKSVSDSVDEMSVIDHGRATFTNQRVIFVGHKQTREWDFSKLLGWEAAAGGYIFMAVTNRQKMSGLAGGPSELMAPVAFELAQIVASDGLGSAAVSAGGGAYSASKQAAFASNMMFLNETKIEQFRKETEEAVSRRLDELEKAGVDHWVDPDKPLPEPQHSEALGPLKSGNGRMERKTKELAGKVPEELEVVGEFFQSKSFASLRRMLNTRGETEHYVEAELRCEPENPFSESGKAVAVFVSDQKVGFVPELLAPTIFAMVDAKGGSVLLGARLWLDHEESRPDKSSVQVFIDSRLTEKE